MPSPRLINFPFTFPFTLPCTQPCPNMETTSTAPPGKDHHMITEAQADESAELAIQYFGQASTMYSQMSHMAPWLPSYEELDKKAASLMAAGHAARLTYTTWRDQ